MRKIRESILLFKKLFPEESFLSGLNNLPLNFFDKEKNSSFSDRFYNHLLFYKRNLYPLPFERMYKAGNIIFYHLQRGKILNHYFLNAIGELLEFPKNLPFYLNESISKRFLKSVLKAYLDFDKKNKNILTSHTKGVLEKKSKRIFRSPTKNFEKWQSNLYGLRLLDKNTLMAEARAVKKEIKSDIKVNDFYLDLKFLIGFFIDYFQNIFEEDITNIKFLETPEYLKPIISTGAAYTFNRLKSNSECIVFIDFDKRISPAKIMLVLFHEVFGHILHFKLIDKYCSSHFKKISYLSRFPLTEGFALLAEDYLLEIMAKEKTQKDFEKNLGKGFSGRKTFLILKNLYFKSRLLRYLRYIFEYEVYCQNKSPRETIEDLSETFKFDREFLEEDLLSFLVTPGYASCYIGGYKILKKLGNYENFSFRKHLGKKGFDFAMDL